MKIEEEFKRLMAKFKKGVDSGGHANITELFKESIHFFEVLKEMVKGASEEEKKEILKVMAEMHQFLIEETKRLAQKTGLSEEQMLRYAENPSNFSPQQWRALEAVREKLSKTANELSSLLKKDQIPEKSPSPEKMPQDSLKKKRKSSKRDSWLRS